MYEIIPLANTALPFLLHYSAIFRFKLQLPGTLTIVLSDLSKAAQVSEEKNLENVTK